MKPSQKSLRTVLRKRTADFDGKSSPGDGALKIGQKRRLAELGPFCWQGSPLQSLVIKFPLNFHQLCCAEAWDRSGYRCFTWFFGASVPPCIFLRSWANGSLISSSFTVFSLQQEGSFCLFTQSLGNRGRMLHTFAPFTRKVATKRGPFGVKFLQKSFAPSLPTKTSPQISPQTAPHSKCKFRPKLHSAETFC